MNRMQKAIEMWIANDADRYGMARGLGHLAIAEALGRQVQAGGRFAFDAREFAVGSLAAALREWHEGQAGELNAHAQGWMRDALAWELAEVDWRAMAEGIIEELWEEYDEPTAVG